jgi:hypothetical protein
MKFLTRIKISFSFSKRCSSTSSLFFFEKKIFGGTSPLLNSYIK